MTKCNITIFQCLNSCHNSDANVTSLHLILSLILNHIFCEWFYFPLNQARHPLPEEKLIQKENMIWGEKSFLKEEQNSGNPVWWEQEMDV